LIEAKSSAGNSVKSGHKNTKKGGKQQKGQKNEEDEIESMDSFLILDDEEIN